MATIIKPNGTEAEVSPKSGTVFSIREMQEIVQGYFDFFKCPDEKHFIVFNTQGEIRGLAPNAKADRLAGMKKDTFLGDVLYAKIEEIL